MTFLTSEEYNEVKTKVKQIEEFVRKEVLPYIEGGHVIPFGTERTKSGKLHLELCIDGGSQDIHGYSGHLWISFNPNFQPRESGGGVSIYNSLSYGGNFGYQLIADWPTIKSKLFDLKTKKTIELSERKSVLQSFQI